MIVHFWVTVTFKLVPIKAPAPFSCHTDIQLLVSSRPKNLFGVQRGKNTVLFWGVLIYWPPPVVTPLWIHKQSQSQLRKGTVKMPVAIVY